MRAKRLDAVQNRINRFPYRYAAIDDAYAQFLDDGTLPEDRALAGRVLDRVLKARKPYLEPERAGLWQPYGSTREMLFREACSKVEVVRNFARFLLKTVVEAGYDPTDSEVFGTELEPMDFAPISLQLLGFPHDFVRPEYQGQLHRVLRQHAELPRLDSDDDIGPALSAFMTKGRLPSDPRHLPHVLRISEQFALVAHYFERGGEDLLAAYDAVANSTGDQRVAALRRLGELQAHAQEAHG